MKAWILVYMIIQDGVILASHHAPASPYATRFIISLEMGRTWVQLVILRQSLRNPGTERGAVDPGLPGPILGPRISGACRLVQLFDEDAPEL